MKAAVGTHPCHGCGIDVRKCLADRAVCKRCRDLIWERFLDEHRGDDPTAYQRAYNATFGTVAGLVAAAMAIRSEPAAA